MTKSVVKNINIYETQLKLGADKRQSAFPVINSGFNQLVTKLKGVSRTTKKKNIFFHILKPDKQNIKTVKNTVLGQITKMYKC